MFRGSLVFGDKNQSVVAGLGLFLNHGTHGTHGRESLHSYALFPCIRVVLWFPDFRGQEPIRGRRTQIFKPRNTQNTRKGILVRLCLVSVYSGCSVVPWFSETRPNPWSPDSDFFKPRNTQNSRKGILARLCLISVNSSYSVVPFCKV